MMQHPIRSLVGGLILLLLAALALQLLWATVAHMLWFIVALMVFVLGWRSSSNADRPSL
jgi:hypothetical protein